jgi:hypothetical protein
MRFLIFVAIVLLVLSSMQATFGNNIDSNKTKIVNGTGYEHYSNSVIIIFGKCNEVTGPLLWKFGFYCNLIKKEFTINAKEEDGEIIHLIIRGHDNFKFLWRIENINVELKGATGILFWGVKSIIMDSPYIFARCKARDIYLTE